MATRGKAMSVRPSTTWYDLKPEVVPVHLSGVLWLPAPWYGWYDLLLSLAHTRRKTGISGYFRKEKGSGQKVVLSVLEPWKSLVEFDFRWYDLNSEVVLGRTNGGPE